MAGAAGATPMLDGRTAFVTGAGSGIGRASAMAFARYGARVMVVDVAEAGAKETVRQIEEAGGRAAWTAADVTDEAQVRSAVEATVEAFGGLDVAHNNAGVAGPLGSTVDLDVADLRRILDVNVVGVFLGMKHEIATMLEHGGGSIVNTSSGAGVSGVPGMPGYSASKHAVIGLTKSAAMEYGGRGVRVNAVCPGPIDTPMLDGVTAGDEALRRMFASTVPMRREGTPAEVAELVAWLCSDAASYVNGAAVPVDGGATA